ncbi:MAG: hypothetical protein M3O71_14545 [Bacteroidota bacterium]|nr:hypothetical protein [Bacteroidota bacterium]
MADNNLDKITEASTVAPDNKANLEYKDLFHKHIRDKRRFGAINWCFIIFVWICLISVGGIIVIRILHMLLPSKYCWMTKEQLSGMNEFFFDGGVGGLVVGFLKSSIIDKEK